MRDSDREEPARVDGPSTEPGEGPIAHLLEPVVHALTERVDRAAHEIDPFQRDPEFVKRVLPLLELIDWYYHSEIRGWESLPDQGPFLIVGNHSGGAVPVDPFPFVSRWVAERGAAAELYLLTYDLDFGNPLVAGPLRKLGCIPAGHENARSAFDRGAPVVVFPGGDYEVFRPWSERNRIDFGGRKGFLRLALSTGVPIVPMTIHGAHESTLVLTRGSGIAHAAGLDRLNVKVFPLIWSLPFGPAPGFVPSAQLPSKVTIQLGEPMTWGEFGPADADDPRALERCYDDVTGVMQAAMDEMAREDPHPILTRLDELRPSRLIARRWRALFR